MAVKRWRRKLSAKETAARRRAAMAAARAYLTGQKVRRYESPKMIAAHGRDPWPPKKAAAEAYNHAMLETRVSNRYPTVEVERHQKGKLRAGERKTKTSTGGKWTLRKAGVARSKTTGRFKKRV